MDDKLNELKEKQHQIGDKISLLQQMNKKKDEEAAEIRQLIAECRENLNRIKGISTDGEPLLAPCSEFDEPEKVASEGGSIVQKDEPSKSVEDRFSAREEKLSNRERPTSSLPHTSPRRPCAKSGDVDRKRCAELLAKRDCKPPDSKKKKKEKGKGEKVSCKVDLSKMKVRIRGPSEDLKKLNAAELINLLEKFQCQELIINTGEEMIQDPGEIRLVYFLHPGNIVMMAGIIMIAFLINANLCNVKRTSRTKSLFNVLYLGSFAFHYGMVLWMSFIRGYALRFGLSHDTFNLVDNLILPKYYSICVLLSALTLYSFLATHCVAPCTSWPLEVLIQMVVVVVTFFIELIAICYVIPALIKLRDATDDYIFDDEDECNVPESYEKNLVKLGKLNWTVCLINFLTLVFLGANIYYITSKLNIGNTN